MNRCQGVTKSGNPCKYRATDDSNFCLKHQKQGQQTSEQGKCRVTPGQRQITCVGLWLPCGRTNYFHPGKDQVLLKNALPGAKLSDFRIYALKVELSAKLDNKVFGVEESDALNNSVYRRLLTVLHERGYLYAIPFFPEYRLDYLSVVGDSDPNVVVLMSGDKPFTRRNNPLQLASEIGNIFYSKYQTESDEAQNRIKDLDKSTENMFKKKVLNVCLVVSDEGFYQWLFYHEPIGEQYSEFVSFLKDHIRFLIGQLAIPKSDPTGRIMNSINWEQLRENNPEFERSGLQQDISHKETNENHLNTPNATEKYNISSRQAVDNLTRSMLNQYRSTSRAGATSPVIEQHRQEKFSGLYRQYPGILVFFQLNLIMEGILNALNDPRIFFADRFRVSESLAASSNHSSGELDEWGEMVLYESANYSLSGFATSLLTYSLVGTAPELHSKLVKIMDDSLGYLSQLAIDTVEEDREKETLQNLRSAMKLFISEVHQNGMRRDFLRQFLRKTAVFLQQIKWNLEDCRRALLSHSIGVTDYHEFLVQIKSPDQRALKFDKANEAQISGYAKLSSAKLPILKNVQRYIQLIFDSSNEGELVRNPNLEYATHNLKEIFSYYQMWNNFCNAIEENIVSLERTLDRVNAERRLYEQSQTRYEQEAMAEIDRRRQRLGISASGEVSSRLPSFLEVSLAFIGAISAIFTITYGISQPFIIRPWAYSVLVPFVIIYLFFVLVRILGGYIAQTLILRRNRYYYELDIQLNLPIDHKNAGKLFDQGFSIKGEAYEQTNTKIFQIPREVYVALKPDPKGQASGIESSSFAAVTTEEKELFLRENAHRLPVFSEPEKTSYRFSQSALSQADHKVHYEFNIYWEPLDDQTWLDKLFRPFSRNSMENCELIYEVLSHSPSSDQQYMLRELRFVATYKDRLTIEQIALLKLKLTNNFIYFWIAENQNVLNSMDVVQNIAPVFSLTVEALLATGQ